MISPANAVHVAIELSTTVWLIGTRLPGVEKPRMHRLPAGDVAGLLALVAELRTRAAARLGKSSTGACCFGAGRDGFWLHRVLSAHDIASHVVEPTSILVTDGPGVPRPTDWMRKECRASSAPISAGIGRSAAWWAFHPPNRRTPSARTANGSTWPRSAPGTRTASSPSW